MSERGTKGEEHEKEKDQIDAFEALDRGGGTCLMFHIIIIHSLN